MEPLLNHELKVGLSCPTFFQHILCDNNEKGIYCLSFQQKDALFLEFIVKEARLSGQKYIKNPRSDSKVHVISTTLCSLLVVEI